MFIDESVVLPKHIPNWLKDELAEIEAKNHSRDYQIEAECQFDGLIGHIKELYAAGGISYKDLKQLFLRYGIIL